MKLGLQTAGAFLLTVTLAKAASTRFCRLRERWNRQQMSSPGASASLTFEEEEI
ncbi:MAG: hypothetical protein O6918_12585 [Deltaproteobacteria bacterium]|nr:hypothetical protein [Deltaproteobacteria bacterium]